MNLLIQVLKEFAAAVADMPRITPAFPTEEYRLKKRRTAEAMASLMNVATPAVVAELEALRPTIARVVGQMRNQRYRTLDIGFVDGVSAARVDDWANELEALALGLSEQPTGQVN